MAKSGFECVSVTSSMTGVIDYVDIPTGEAQRLLEAGPGDFVRFHGNDYVVCDAYEACVELRSKGRVIVVDLAADPSPLLSEAIRSFHTLAA